MTIGQNFKGTLLAHVLTQVASKSGVCVCVSQIKTSLCTSSEKCIKLGYIGCQFLPPGGSIGPRYVLQFYLLKNYKI
jgi:hypothetical protein